MDEARDKPKQTISKSQALETCRECKEFGAKGCILADIEGSQSDTIFNIPECILNAINQGETKPTDTVRNPCAMSPDTVRNNKNIIEKPIRKFSQKTPKNAHCKEINIAFSGVSGGDKNPIITKAEEEVLHLISQGITSTNRIAKIKNRNVRVIQYHIKNLKQKGILSKTFEILRFGGGTSASSEKVYTEKLQSFQPEKPMGCNPDKQLPTGSAAPRIIETNEKPHMIRLHGEQFHANILEKLGYKVKPGTMISIDNNKIYCWKDSIDIYSNNDFWGKNADEATILSCNYWNRLFTQIENTLKISIIKDRAENIVRNKAHYAEINNELAQDAIDHDYKIRIRSTKDGMVWALCDFSNKVPEFEAVDGKQSQHDMQDTIAPFMNDRRDNPSPLPSEAWKLQSHTDQELNRITTLVYEIGAGLATLTKIMAPKQEAQTQQPTTNENIEGYR